MSMAPGSRLGPYEILAPIGAGGMGEVYRAKDTNLDREVAIKVLPVAVAQDSERLARFEREAKVLAALNHPNIAQIYGLEESSGVRALVIELIPGETIKGPLPLETALNYAKQIAEALEAAHDQGIVHRDLKPANIMITPGGVVKLLDFGLAAVAPGSPGDSDSSSSPTLTIAITQVGWIMGTAAYMSPEQARGQPVDKRADIWAFGVVLYEILTGKQAFQGATTTDILAAVVKEEPTLDALPAHLRPIIERCLRKDPRKRWRDVGDVRIALEEGIHVDEAPAHLRSWLPWAAASILTVALIIAGVALWRATRPVQHSMMRLSVDLGQSVSIQTNAGANVIVSPDGTRLVFASKGPDGEARLSTRLLSQSQATPLSGTEGARGDAFFSPGGDWIGFFADGKLKKISVQGGAPVTLCDALNPRGASWGDDGNVVFAPNIRGGLVRVSSNGGTPQSVTELMAGEVTHRWPQVLPAAKGLLFTAANTPNYENASIDIQSLKGGQRKTLHKGGSYGRYVPSGHLVYIHQGALFARAFDLDRMEVTGVAAPILDDVAISPVTGSAQIDFSGAPSGSGTLVYLAGKSAPSIYWLDRTGKTQPLHAAPALYTTPRFSPDGKRLVVSLFSGNTGLWISDWERDAMLRLTFTAGDNNPVWSPDGNHLVYESAQTGIFWIRSDGSGTPERITRSEHLVYPYSFSPDGKLLAYSELSRETGSDIWLLPLEGNDPDHPRAGQPQPLLRSAANERDPAFSPDGRWMAYTSDESGAYEVYVRPFPDAGGKWRVSNMGGKLPIWSKAGRELAYQTLDGRIMMVSYVAIGGSFKVSKPTVWSDKPFVNVVEGSTMDLAPDGKRFAVLMPQEGLTERRSPGELTFLLNFFDELRRLLPASK